MYPNRSQYKNAVLNEMYPVDENGGYTFSPVLIDNELVFAAGGNATVFKLKDAEGKIRAVKFFTDEIAERFDRFEKISIFLKHNKFPFIVDFEFVKNLIYVPIEDQEEINNFFPGLIMKWIEAPTLENKIKDIITNKKANDILKIAKSFKDLSITILENNFSHGDLKLSNLLIDENLKLHLIDYDGMFIKDFEGNPSFELGTPSYQHPKRTINDFNKSIDHFSILVIYASLIALAYYPDLYLKYNDGDNIILTLEDFNNPNKSELLKTLSSLNETKALAFYIKQSLESDSIYIDNLKDLLNGKFPKPTIEISHSPATPLIGQKVKINWKSNDVDFVKINGTEHNVSGSIEEVVKQNHSLDFEYGNAIDIKRESYKFKSVPKPEIVKFSAKTNEIKFDEKIVLNWEARNFKEAKLTYNKEEVDVKNLKTLTIDNLEKDTIFYLKLVSEIDNYQVEKELKVEVYYPVNLEVTQDKKITFPNRPVNIYFESVNAQKVTLKPQNIDLTGKSSYEIITDKDFSGHIVAENKRYSSPIQRIEIEVLKVPQRPQIIAKLPAIEFKISTPQFIRINKPEIRKGQNVLNQFKTAFEFLNIFKISTNLKRLHEARRK
jgi:serine/threonine protein kinase